MKFYPSILAPRTWATGTYPAGPDPWAGGAQRIDPVANQFTPGEHPAAQEVNYLVGHSSDRLGEARADLIALARIHEATSVRDAATQAEELRGIAMTPSGRVFKLAKHASAGDAFGLLGPEGFALQFAAAPNAGGNNTPTCVSANGENVLFGDSPDSYIYDAAGNLFSGAVNTGGAATLLEAQPIAGGWLTVWADSASFAAGATAVLGPRTFEADPARSFQIRTVTTAGVVDADTASVALAGAMATFANNDWLHLHLVRKSATEFFFLVSGNTGQKRFAAYSSDAGATWTTSTLPNPFPASDTTWTAEYCEITSTLLLAVSDATTTNVYRSTDLGASWVLGNSGTRNGSTPSDGPFSLYDMRRGASGLIYGVGYDLLSAGGIGFRPVFASVDGVAWHMVAAVSVSGTGWPTLAAQDAPFQALGGAGYGARYPQPGLSGFGCTVVSF